LDFAYRIHTNVGHKCHHAKVNGSMVRLDYKLRTNDVVEIVTAANQPGPSRDWLHIVKTQQAKTKIKQWFKKANREENIQKGREMLENAAKRQGQQLSAVVKPEFYEEMLKKFNMSSMDDVYNAIGYGGLTTAQVLHRLLDKLRKQKSEEELKERVRQMEEEGVAPQKPEIKRTTSARGVIVHGEPNMAVRFAQCCGPVPGDEVFGYITRGRGVSVHRADCVNAQNLLEDAGRILPVEWANTDSGHFTVQIGMEAKDRPGILADVTQTLLNMNINITSATVRTEKSGNVNIHLSFDINNASQLSNTLKNLRKIRDVTNAFRVVH
jgi:GTP pyrophosphokinase